MPLLRAQTEPYRLSQGGDAVWPPVRRAYGGPVPQRRWQPLLRAIQMVGRLILPVILTLVLLGAVYLYSDALLPATNISALFRTGMLAVSDLVLPLAWFSIQLTNRRYGPAYAFAQLLAALALGAAIVLANPYDVNDWVAAVPVLTMRAMLSFGAAFLLANFVGIVFFDGARGPSWWSAPLAGSLAASLVFSAVYYPAAFAGVYAHWTDFAAAHCLVFSAVSLLLLAPYWLLRPAMRPMPGLNGY